MAANMATNTATGPPEEDDQNSLRLDTTTSPEGRTTTVIRDKEGHVAYPAYVPPEVKELDGLSPTSPGAPAPRHLSAENGPRKTNTEPLHDRGAVKIDTGSKPDVRPPKSRPPAKKYATEVPRRGERRVSSLPNVLKRAGTNVSQLNAALWQQPTQDEESSSSGSSSSSSEDEDDDAHRREAYRRFRVGNDNYRTKGKVSKRDGRLNIHLKDTSNTGYLAKALGMAVKKVVPLGENIEEEDEAADNDKPKIVSRLSSASTAAGVDTITCPRMNIVIMVIGSRGDAQPFLKIGKVLKEQYGHRVRIATHPAFREFVEQDSGLEFFSVGGDPSELMAFMVKNPGMIPTIESVKAGDIGRRRAAMAEMFEGFWRACINATDDEKDIQNVKMMGEKDPFVADAIIANPPSFAHIHCAEALGIPLHLMFTFPYTPTQAFPHPLASIKKSNVDPGYTNFISYPLVEMMVWQGLGDLVNDFRTKTLGLDPVSTLWAPGATYRLHVPFSYLWSPGLVPKPSDWGPEVDVSGFVFLDLASTFTPPDPLTKFMDAGEAPIYIGFGSIVVDDADRFTQMIFEAVKKARVRALVSKGWGGLGGDEMDIPENIFMLENTPHDWLFPKVRACVIHGGAGTTAIALKCGKPTMIVPFFGDQHFWGSMVGNAKAGPDPVPYKHLTAEKLAEGIKYCLTDEAVKAAETIAKDIELEGDGAENAVRAFHSHLTLSGQNSMRCSIFDDKIASWKLKNTNLRLSAMAADMVVEKGYLSWRKLRLLRHNEWNDFEGPGEPVTGIAGSLVTTAGNVFGGVGGIPYRLHKSKQKRKEKKERRRQRHQQKRELAAKAKAAKTAMAQSQNAPNGSATVETNGETHDATDRPSAQPTQAVDHATNSQKTIAPDGSGQNLEQENSNSSGQDQAAHLTTMRDVVRRRETAQTNDTASTAETEHPAEEVAHHIGHGAVKSAKALAHAPVDLSLAVAQGFHNAPRLYGDDTVRRPPRVTGIHSGLRAARHEFVYGIYDGWTGLVRLPARGAKADGVRGFAKGVGMGITGLVLKDIAALAGPVGYTLKGVAKQIDRGKGPVAHVRRARIIQGQREVRALGEEERTVIGREVGRGWEVMRALWEAMEERERKAGFRRRVKAKSGRGLGAAFESVHVAEQALAALKRGEDVGAVVGEEPRKSHDDGGRKGKGMAGRQAGGKKAEEKKKKKKNDKAEEEETVDMHEPPKPVAQQKKEVQERNANGPVKTPAEEKDNPFSASFRQMEKNKEATREEEQILTNGVAA